MLRQGGWRVNAKRVARIWRRERLKVPSKQPKRGRLWIKEGSCIRLRPEYPNHVWSYDFVEDRMHDGKKYRMLNVIDEFTQECLAIRVNRKLKSADVIDTLSDLFILRGILANVRSDDGAEFTGQLVDLWAYHHGTRIDFSRPGKPTDNAFIETFNGTLRDECLNIHWFGSINEAKRLIEAWRIDYNESRPHMALGNKTPSAYCSHVIPLPQAEGLRPAES